MIQTFGVKVVNRLVFRGGWTLLAWRLHKERFVSQAKAVAAFDRMADTIRHSGLR